MDYQLADSGVVGKWVGQQGNQLANSGVGVNGLADRASLNGLLVS